MNFKQRILQRLLILIPGLLVFYCYVLKCKLPLVYALVAIQFTTHLYLMLSGKQCNPKVNNICNKFAFIIGIIFTGIVLKYKLGVIPLFISLYMIVSHILTIYPLNGTFEYKNIELPIFNKNSYIFVYCDLFHEKKLSEQLDEFIRNTDGCIIDAGAYIGDSFLLPARKYPDKTFYMIEPSETNANFIDRVKTDNVIVLRKLLSDKRKIYKGFNENQPNASYKEDTTGELESIPVDQLICEKVGIMHYDVEGMELEVILGSINLIKRDRPIVIIESLGKDLNKTNQIKTIMENLNYKYYIIDESCNAMDFFDVTKCRNNVFIPL